MRLRGSVIKEALLWTMIAASLVLMLRNAAVNYGWSRAPETYEPEIASGTDLSGFRLKQLGGQEFVIPSEGALLISFLTSGCAPCQQQVQALNEAVRRQKYAKVIAVFFEPATLVAEFEATLKPEFLCTIDAEGALANSLRLSTFPQTVEIKNGAVIRGWVGKQSGF